MDVLLHLNNEMDLAVLEPLFQHMNLRYEKKIKTKEKTEADRIALLARLNYWSSQIKGTSFGDAVEYQKEVRKDKPLPFRDEN